MVVSMCQIPRGDVIGILWEDVRRRIDRAEIPV